MKKLFLLLAVACVVLAVVVWFRHAGFSELESDIEGEVEV